MTAQSDPSRDAMREEIRRNIRRRARARTGFTWHFVVFVMLNVALYAINQRYSPGVQWFVWPLAAWGAGLFMHGFALFSAANSEGRLEAEVERELARRAGG
jgi:hypothetical protein